MNFHAMTRGIISLRAFRMLFTYMSYTNMTTYYLVYIPLQQEYVLTELEEYAMQTPAPVDSASVQHVVMYLKACNKMFERGILEKKGFIKSTQSPVLSSIKDGFRYFSEWADKAIDEGKCIHNYVLKYLFFIKYY